MKRLMCTLLAVALVLTTFSVTALAAKEKVDFASFGEAVGLSTTETEIVSSSLGTIYAGGLGGSDYINAPQSVYRANNYASGEGGIWWNGANKSGATARFLRIAPSEDMEIILTLRQSFNSTSTPSYINIGVVVSTSSKQTKLSQSYTTVRYSLGRNMTYYIWPTGTGAEISQMTLCPAAGYGFDFAALGETHLTEAGHTIGNLTVYGRSSATDYFNPPASVYSSSNGNASSQGGIWWNGGYSSSSTRYLTYTPSCSGTLAFRLRNTYNKGSSTASYLRCGKTAAGSSQTASSPSLASTNYVYWSIDLTGGTTYYFWPASSGVNIASMSFCALLDNPEAVLTAQSIDGGVGNSGKGMLRFVTEVSVPEGESVEYYGTYVIPQRIFEGGDDSTKVMVKKTGAIEDAQTFSIDLLDIPSQYFDEDIYAWSFAKLDSYAAIANGVFDTANVNGVVNAGGNE